MCLTFPVAPHSYWRSLLSSSYLILVAHSLLVTYPSQFWSFVGLSLCVSVPALFFFGVICHRWLLEFFCLLFDSGLWALRGCGSLLITIYCKKKHLWWGVSSDLGLGLVSISYLLMCTSVTPKCGCSAHSFASMSQFPRLCNLQPACLKGVYSNHHIIWSLI